LAGKDNRKPQRQQLQRDGNPKSVVANRRALADWAALALLWLGRIDRESVADLL